MTRVVSITLVTLGAIGAGAQLFAYVAYFEPSLLGAAFFAILAVIGLLRRNNTWIRKTLVVIVVAVSVMCALVFVAATVFGLDWQPRIISGSTALFFSTVLMLVTRRFRPEATTLVCAVAIITLVISQAWLLRLAREDSFMRQGERIMIWR